MAAAATRSGIRLDATGFAVAILAHVALLYILTRDRADTPPDEPAAMEVSFVEEVGPVSSSPVTAAEPAPTFGEEISPETASGADASTPAPVTPPVPEPVRPPVETGERRRPDVTQNRVPVRPAPPPRVADRQPQRPQPRTPPRPNTRPGPSGPSFADVARRVGGGVPSARPGPSAPAAATVTAQARASFTAALGRQIARCSRQQRPATLEARTLRPVVVIRLRQDGSLDGSPVVRSVEGLNGTNRQYETQAREAIVRAVRSCAPYTGLPPELYAVANGWRQPPPIRLTFQ